MSHQLFANDIISYTFVTELSTHSNCFVDFYQVVEKQLCLETLEFFFLGLDYKLSPACQRRVTEKQIFEYFVAIKAKRQINISAKLRQTVESQLGFGKSNIFDECILHCAESLSTNFWLDFSKQLRNSPPVDKKSVKPISKDVLAKLVPKYLKNPVLTFFGRHSYKIPNFFLQDDKDLKTWLVRTDADKLTDLILDLLKIDPDLYFTQNVIRVLADRSLVIIHFIGECVKYEQRHADNKAIWRLTSGFPLEVLLYFVFNCAKKELNKALKKIIDSIYEEWSSPSKSSAKTDTNEGKRVITFIGQLINELIRPNDVAFRKVKIMLCKIYAHCKRVYGSDETDAWVLRNGVINIMFKYVVRCMDEPSLVGAQPLNGCFARPNINIMIDIFNLYTMHPSVVGTLEHKEQWFKDLYNQFLNLPDDTLGKLNKFYADAVDTDFDSAINEYNRLVTAEYNKLGYGGIGDCFLYEDEIMFIGQHLVTLGSNVGERTRELQNFLDENGSLTDLRLGLKRLKFPEVQPVTGQQAKTPVRSSMSRPAEKKGKPEEPKKKKLSLLKKALGGNSTQGSEADGEDDEPTEESSEVSSQTHKVKK